MRPAIANKLIFSNLIAQPMLAPSSPAPMLVIGGRAPAPEWLKVNAKGRTIFAIDHGLDVCFAADIIPELFLGDCDSADKASLQRAKELQIPTEKYPIAKDLTDTELALEKIKAGEVPDFLLLTGCFGGRFDHLFSTIYSFLYCGLPGCMIDDREALFFLQANEELTLEFPQQPKAISLLPLSRKCQGVTTKGLRWPLENSTLNQSLPYTVSNELTTGGNTCYMSLRQGILGVYINFQEQ